MMPAKTVKLIKDDEPSTLCAFVGCNNPWSISGSTLGGRGYCRNHAWVILNDPGPRKPMEVHDLKAEAKTFCSENGLDSIDDKRAFLKAEAGKVGGLTGLDWARKLLSRAADGEDIPMRILEMARAALNRTQREPGED